MRRQNDKSSSPRKAPIQPSLSRTSREATASRTRRAPTLAQLLERMFPSGGEVPTRLAAIQRRFVVSLAESGSDVEIPPALRRLLDAAAKHGSDDVTQFSERLVYRLAACWDAYRTKDIRTLKGFSDKGLARLGRRLEKTAAAIARVNASYYRSPVRRLSARAAALPPYGGWIAEQASTFARLPVELRAYAAALQNVRRPPRVVGHKGLAHLVPSKRPPRYRSRASDAEMEFVELLERETGTLPLADAAPLLLAAYCFAMDRPYATVTTEAAEDKLLRRFSKKGLFARVDRYRKQHTQPVRVNDLSAMSILAISIAARIERSNS